MEIKTKEVHPIFSRLYPPNNLIPIIQEREKSS